MVKMKQLGLIAGTDQDKPPKITEIATTLDTVCGRWKIGFYKTYVVVVNEEDQGGKQNEQRVYRSK